MFLFLPVAFRFFLSVRLSPWLLVRHLFDYERNHSVRFSLGYGSDGASPLQASPPKGARPLWNPLKVAEAPRIPRRAGVLALKTTGPALMPTRAWALAIVHRLAQWGTLVPSQ